MRGGPLSSGKSRLWAVSTIKNNKAFSCQPLSLCAIAFPMPGIFCRRDLTEGLQRGPETVWKLLRDLLPGTRVICLNQVHADRVIRGEDVPDGTFPEADGVISMDPSMALCVRTADCVPVLMWDDDLPVTAAVHAGWRGLALEIIPKAIARMRSCGALSIHVSMGPSIGPCCYAVGQDVIDALHTEPDRVCEGRLFVDLHRVAMHQALCTGVDPGHIHQVQSCTCCNREAFYSYRRDGELTGRNVSVIGGNSCSLPGLRAL